MMYDKLGQHNGCRYQSSTLTVPY